MEYVLLTGYILSAILAYGVLVHYDLHMFQLNSYKHREYLMWLRQNSGSRLGRVLGLVLSAVCLFFYGTVTLAAALFLNILTIYGNRPKKAKKPLVMTKRVKRLSVTIGLLMAVFLGAEAVFYIKEGLEPGRRLLFLVPVFLCLTPFLVLLSDLLNRPYEKHINRGFIKEAEKILEGMPDLKVIGITGSYGKTSVKYFLNKILSGKYQVLMTPGNYNTTLGVVITVRENLRAVHEVFLCEMGAKNTGDIKEICDLVKPDYGVITSIGPQHLESFLTIENVVKTKFELADAVPSEGKVFLNYDNEWIVKHPLDKSVVSYGIENQDSIFRPFDISVSSKGSLFKMKLLDGKIYEFSTKLIGRHNVLNIAGAIAVACELEVPPEVILAQVRKLEPVEHRLQLLNHPQGVVIDDAYNSNPSGARAALDTLKEFEGVRILVTPGMIELGEKQYECNKEFGRQAAGAADYIILVGEKQTKPIQDGVREARFSEEKLFVVSDLQEGMNRVNLIKAEGRQKIILLENDLPDNY